jgi:hypothetical protein
LEFLVVAQQVQAVVESDSVFWFYSEFFDGLSLKYVQVSQILNIIAVQEETSRLIAALIALVYFLLKFALFDQIIKVWIRKAFAN